MKTILTIYLFLGFAFNLVAQQYQLVRTIGSPGSLDGQFNNLHYVTSDAQYNLYVADAGNHRIQKFDSAGNFLLKWGAYGTANGQFLSPSFITADANGFIYVSDADASNPRISKFDVNGNFIMKWGSSGTLQSQFKGFLTALKANNGFVYVMEYTTDSIRIKKFTDSGVYVLQWRELIAVINPEGIATDSQGNVCLLSPGGTVRKYTANGIFISQWGSSSQFTDPWSINIDANDRYYITEYDHSSGKNRFQKFNAIGTLDTFNEWNCSVSNDFTSVHVSVNGYVYVSENYSSTVKVFSTGIPYVPVTTGISASQSNDAISLFPNPSYSETNLFISDPNGFVKVVIYDVTGSLVYENAQVPSDVNFTFPEFPSGVYAVKVTGSKGMTTKKLIKL